MRKINLAIPLCLMIICVFTFQNCAPTGFVVDDVESFSTELASSLPLRDGSSKLNPFSCSADSQSSQPILRLSRDQYSNTVKNLVGSEAYTKALPLISTLYADTLKKSIKDFSPSISDTQMTAYQSIAEVVYNTIKTSTTSAQALAGACIAQTPVTTTCRDDFLKSFGLKAFRRPLEAAEVTHWGTKVFALGQNGVEGVALTAYGMMLSPYFLLRTELGISTSTEGNIFRLSPYELAARISYDLTDSPPDAMLTQAASTNALSTIEQVKPHVDRLINSPRGRAKVLAFFNFWLDPHRHSATAYTADFLKGLDVLAVNNEFEREMNEYLEQMVFVRNATLTDLLTSRESFARTPAVAGIYGHAPVVAGGAPAVTGSERKGLLMRGSILATEGNETHPILRGVKVRTRFLCEVMGLPSGVMTNDPTFFSDDARTKLSTRDRTAGLTGSVSCMGCHQSINPAGFAFENFDGLGRVRTVEKAYSVLGTPLAEHAIRTSSSNVQLGSSETYSIRDGLDLIDRMLEENKMPACFLRQAHRFYKVQSETMDDGCVLSQSYSKLMLEGQPLIEALKSRYLHSSVLSRRTQ